MSVILERNASGATITSYVRNPLAPGGIGGIISSSAGGQHNYYHYDGIGTVTTLTNSTAAVTAAYDYDAFGNVLSQSGSTTNTRTFLTKETSSAGLVYFGARYYDPKIGRFITKDPSGMSDGPNVYVYCKSDPINYVDLWGLCGEKNDLSLRLMGYYVSTIVGIGTGFIHPVVGVITGTTVAVIWDYAVKNNIDPGSLMGSYVSTITSAGISHALGPIVAAVASIGISEIWETQVIEGRRSNY